MSRILILPYKMSSTSAKVLARELGARRIKSIGSSYQQQPDDVVINWGCSHNQSIIPSLNKCAAVNIACNKLLTHNTFTMNEVSQPAWTVGKERAATWIEEGYRVYCRKVLTGHSGSGIIVASTVDELVEAPLYTKQVYAGKEFRVHVFNGEVIDYAKKGRKRVDSTYDRASSEIRSYSKGWVFIREGIQLPQAVKQESLKAIKALGLDFGAVDICTIKGTNDEQVCVYEVNTSPGIHSSTIKSYADAIRRYINA